MLQLNFQVAYCRRLYRQRDNPFAGIFLGQAVKIGVLCAAAYYVKLGVGDARIFFKVT